MLNKRQTVACDLAVMLATAESHTRGCIHLILFELLRTSQNALLALSFLHHLHQLQLVDIVELHKVTVDAAGLDRRWHIARNVLIPTKRMYESSESSCSHVWCQLLNFFTR